MSPSSTVHGGQHDTKYVTFELLLLHASFVADDFLGFMLEPARIYLANFRRLLLTTAALWAADCGERSVAARVMRFRRK